MNVFVDTSAFIAVIDGQEPRHGRARRTWDSLLQGNDFLVTTNYVVAETVAVLQRAVGLTAVRIFFHEILPAITVEWINQPTHDSAIVLLLAANQRKLSLVDCTSFETMRRLGTDAVFAFDRHFKEQGFSVMP